MRKTVFKASGLLLIIATMVVINVQVFRSEFPLLWLATFLGSVVALILFPYKNYFKNNKN